MFNLVSDSTAILQYMCAIKDLKIQLKKRKKCKVLLQDGGSVAVWEKTS